MLPAHFWVYFAVSGRFNNCVEHKIYVGLNTSWFLFGVDTTRSGNNTKKKKRGERKSEDVRKRDRSKKRKERSKEIQRSKIINGNTIKKQL